jgi:cell division protein FtsZ
MVPETAGNLQRQNAAQLAGVPTTPPHALAGEQATRMASARIAAVGVGGAGTNAINHMIKVGVSGVEFIAMNTDAQALETALAPTHVRLGEMLTHGLGAGGNPEIGEQAARESYEHFRDQLTGSDMVFITAGMGGGTGTGASPLVAQAAREVGALTVAVVTTPFAFERRRKLIASSGVEALREVVDALILVPNERLMELHPSDLGAFEAYRLADDVLRQGIQGISDLITIPGLINLDFADIRAVMTDTGSALMSVSRASGEQRAERAASEALTNPLLDIDISGARAVIFNITGSDDLTMGEVHRIAEAIAAAAHPEANIIFGSVYDPTLSGAIKLTVVATGFEPRVVHSDLPTYMQRARRETRATRDGVPIPSPDSRDSRDSRVTTFPAPPVHPPTGPERQHARTAGKSDMPSDPAPPELRVARPAATGSSQPDEDEVRLRRLEELRARRHREWAGHQEEEFLAGGELGSDGRNRQPWKRFFGRR